MAARGKEMRLGAVAVTRIVAAVSPILHVHARDRTLELAARRLAASERT